MTDDRTTNKDIPLPSPDNKMNEDLPRLREALMKIDQELEDNEIIALALGG